MPKDSELSSSSQHVSGSKNKRTLDTPTPILTWTVPEAEQWVIKDGEPALMDAETTAGNAGPAGGNADPTLGSQFGLAYREQDSPLNEWTVVATFTIDAFNQLSLSQQQDGRASDRRQIQFDSRTIDADVSALTFDPNDQIALVTIADDEVDPTATYFNYPKTVHQR